MVSALTDHGGAPGESCLSALQEIVHRPRAQVGLHQAGVDVYPTRYHHAAVGLNHLDIPRHNQVLPNLPVEDERQKKMIADVDTWHELGIKP